MRCSFIAFFCCVVLFNPSYTTKRGEGEGARIKHQMMAPECISSRQVEHKQQTHSIKLTRTCCGVLLCERARLEERARDSVRARDTLVSLSPGPALGLRPRFSPLRPTLVEGGRTADASTPVASMPARTCSSVRPRALACRGFGGSTVGHTEGGEDRNGQDRAGQQAAVATWVCPPVR